MKITEWPPTKTSVASWLKQEPVLCQVFPCSHGTARTAYGTPHQLESTHHNLASLPHHPLPPWWKWGNNITSADRFIKTQKTLQKPFDIIISNAVRERCRLAIIIESNWLKKKKTEKESIPIKLSSSLSGLQVCSGILTLPLTAFASPARMISCHQSIPLLWGSCRAHCWQNSVFTKVSLWPITLPCWFNSWDAPIALPCWHFKHQFSRTNNPD